MNKSNLILASAIAIIFTSILIIFSPTSQKLSLSSPTPSPILTELISPTSDPTADWKTYENAEYGFEFKYPNNLSVTKNAIERKFKLGEIGRTYEYEGAAYGYPIIISFSDNKENKNIDQYFEEFKKYLAGREDSIFQKTKLDGYEAGTVNNHLEILTYVIKDNYLISISASLFREEDSTISLELIYPQILSTFKFTDLNDKKLSWVSIDYPKFKFSFKIPKGWYLSNDAMNLSTQQINKNETFDSFGNVLYVLDNPKSTNILTIILDPTKPKYFDVLKTGDLLEFDQILSTFKFTP